MEAAEVCQIARLPEELLSAAICLTTPRDACRAAAISPAFRAAADSDAVWACFLPRDLPLLADGELSHPPPSNKERFLRLVDHPVVLADGLTSMWLDKETGVKCFMLSARKLNIAWGDTPLYWRWIPVTGSSFSEAAQLLHVWWLEIRGNMDSKMLSRNSTYGAYIVFKVAGDAYGLKHPEQITSVSLGGNNSTRRVCLDGFDSDGEDGASSVFRHSSQHGSSLQMLRSRLENDLLPRERADGWKELELGEFYNDGGEDCEVSISLTETSGTVKSGLIVQGIEIRPTKKQG